MVLPAAALLLLNEYLRLRSSVGRDASLKGSSLLPVFPTRFNRRRFLIQSSALSAVALLPMESMRLAAQASLPSETQVDPVKINEIAAKIPFPDTILKFNPDGTRRPFAGNTVICHLPVQSAMRDAMKGLHDKLASASYFPKLGLTSLDSYHMTIFPGANDQNRSASGWPSYVPADAPIEVCSRMVGERMVKAHLSCELPLRVRIDEQATLLNPTACTLRMIPVDEAENRKLRSVRDQLSEIYGFRLKDHDQYGFHITMSYQIAPFTIQEQTTYRSVLKEQVRQIIAVAPVLELGNPEYCTFPDMFRFEPQKLLRCS